MGKKIDNSAKKDKERLDVFLSLALTPSAYVSKGFREASERWALEYLGWAEPSEVPFESQDFIPEVPQHIKDHLGLTS